MASFRSPRISAPAHGGGNRALASVVAAAALIALLAGVFSGGRGLIAGVHGDEHPSPAGRAAYPGADLIALRAPGGEAAGLAAAYPRTGGPAADCPPGLAIAGLPCPHAVTSGSPTSAAGRPAGAPAPQTGGISGKVTDAVSGNPIADICVDAFAADEAWWLGWADTDSSGNYTVTGLPAGQYKVVFWDCNEPPTYAPQWYDDKPHFVDADLIAVTAGQVVHGINAALRQGGKISGVVTAAATSQPLGDICVLVVEPIYGWWVGLDLTAPDGTYTVAALQGGDHKVLFWDCWDAVYALQWYDGKRYFDTADPVLVEEGETTQDIDAALHVGGKIAGTVTDASTGLPVKDICIVVVDAVDEWFSGFAQTAANGAYTAAGLADGPHKVAFFDCRMPAVYVFQWYDGKTTFEAADEVTVTLGETTGGIDAALIVGGRISGRVTNAITGAPVDEICVEVWDVNHEWRGWALSAPNGTYVAGGLPGGEYKVEFWECWSFFPFYADQWFDGKENFVTADLVPVVLGETTEDINAALFPAGDWHIGFVRWGDLDCDGAVAIGDAVKTARQLIGLSLTQTQPCPPVLYGVLAGGVSVSWGDADCNGSVAIGDAVKLARHLVGLSVSKTEPCPALGSQVEVVILAPE